MFVPIDMALERIRRAKGDSATALFFELLYFGEFLAKLTVAGFVAAVQDDRDSHRYRLQHKLVRADGIGEWAQALDDILAGPASQFLLQEAKEDRRVFTERVSAGNWQHQVVFDFAEAASYFGVEPQLSRDKVALRSWFDLFPEFRYKTRGHGAPKVSVCAAASEPLERSL